MIQVKSVGIQFGLSANYYHGESEEVLYDNFIYCIGIGIRGYHYVEKPLTINDNVVDGSIIYDIIDVGRHLGGVSYQPAMKLDSIETKRHLFVGRVIVDEFKGSYLNPNEFVHQLFEHWSKWPKYDLRETCFDTTKINKKLSAKKK